MKRFALIIPLALACFSCAQPGSPPSIGGKESSAVGDPSEFKFDLICTGTKSIIGKKGAEQAINRRLRVDLTTGRWCEGKCEFGMRMTKAEPAGLGFIDTEQDEYGNSGVMFHANRDTGRYNQIETKGREIKFEAGTCKKAPYTTVAPTQF